MELWILRRTDEADGYDEANAFVVRAVTATQARELAATRAGDERAETWLMGDGSTCDPLDGDGLPGVVLRDFSAG